jgi:flagella basal body P-ring formation protein FlgA
VKLALPVLGLLAHAAGADPLRLRADALATTASPAGLLVLDASGAAEPGLSAEAVVWVAGGHALDDRAHGDVLVIAIDAHSRDGARAARLGRFVATLGALRPVHVDGGALRLRLPQRFDVAVAAGVPVLPGLTTRRSWDWVVGGRVARRLGDWGSAGIAYQQRRDDGQLVTEEVGLDAGAAIDRRNDVGARIGSLTELGADVKVNFLRGQRNPLTELQAATGMQVARSVATGQIVETSNVKLPMLVQRLGLITVYSRVGGIEVSTKGRALENGALDDVISVELAGKKRVVVRVVGLDEVEVFAQGAVVQPSQMRKAPVTPYKNPREVVSQIGLPSSNKN